MILTGRIERYDALPEVDSARRAIFDHRKKQRIVMGSHEELRSGEISYHTLAPHAGATPRPKDDGFSRIR